MKHTRDRVFSDKDAGSPSKCIRIGPEWLPENLTEFLTTVIFGET